MMLLLYTILSHIMNGELSITMSVSTVILLRYVYSTVINSSIKAQATALALSNTSNTLDLNSPLNKMIFKKISIDLRNSLRAR